MISGYLDAGKTHFNRNEISRVIIRPLLGNPIVRPLSRRQIKSKNNIPFFQFFNHSGAVGRKYFGSGRKAALIRFDLRSRQFIKQLKGFLCFFAGFKYVFNRERNRSGYDPAEVVTIATVGG